MAVVGTVDVPIRVNVAVRCPVCEGRGAVLESFYRPWMNGSAVPCSCRSCGGTGVVWPPNEG